MIMASRTPAQAAAQKKYAEKVHEIRLRVPIDYYREIKGKLGLDINDDSKETSGKVNKYVLSLIEKDMGDMTTISEQNKINKEKAKQNQ